MTTLYREICDRTFDVVVANILAGPLIELAPVLSANVASDGVLALSGILEEQIEPVCAAYDPWLQIRTPIISDGWALLQGKRR